MLNLILKRQSIRKYKPEKSEQMKQEIQTTINSLRQLGNCPVYLELAETDPGDKGGAPYYVFIRADNNSTCGDDAGFMGEQLILKLTGLGYGTCWRVGSGPRIPRVKDQRNLAKISVGKPDQELYRKALSEFKRVSTDKISGGELDKIIVEAVWLAPSAMNLQPWYIHGAGDIIHVYRRKCAGPLYMEKITSLDIGIALCHIEVAAAHLGFTAVFENAKHPDIEGKKYVTTAILQKKNK